jgi:hypothetical protein
VRREREEQRLLDEGAREVVAVAVLVEPLDRARDTVKLAEASQARCSSGDGLKPRKCRRVRILV